MLCSANPGPSTPPRDLKRQRYAETQLQKEVEEWEKQLVRMFRYNNTDQMVAYQCNDGFRLACGVRNAESTVTLLEEPFFSFNRELDGYGNFCFALSIGGMRNCGIKDFEHGDQHWENECLLNFGWNQLKKLYKEGVNGAMTGALRPEDWPRLVYPDKLGWYNGIDLMQLYKEVVWLRNAGRLLMSENIDAAFLRMAFLKTLNDRHNNCPGVFAYLPTHYDSLYTTFTNESLKKFAEGYFETEMSCHDYGGFPVQRDGSNLDWVEILQTHDKVQLVDLHPVWKAAFGGEGAYIFADDETAVRDIMADIQGSTFKEPMDSDTEPERERFMKFSLPWWATKWLPVEFQEFTSHEMMRDFDVFKKCCIAFSYSSKVVYVLDHTKVPGTLDALEYWNCSFNEWSHDVQHALRSP